MSFLDYEIDMLNKEVGVTIYGNTINEKYTQLLKDNDTLTLEDCILLDAVQKGHRISEENVLALLNRGLLEGDTSSIAYRWILLKNKAVAGLYPQQRFG